MEPIPTFTFVRSGQINAGSSNTGPIRTLVDVDANVDDVDVVRKVKAVVAVAAEAALEVDAVAVVAAQVGIGEALVNVDTVTVR